MTIVGYAASEAGIEAVKHAGATRVVLDTAHARERPRLAECLRSLSAGDTLVVPSAIEMSVGVAHFVATVAGLAERGIHLRCLREPELSTDSEATTVGTLLALDNLRRGLIRARTRAGMDAAASRGRRAGRPTVMTAERIAVAAELRALGRSYAHVAQVLGVSASAVQRALRPRADQPSGS